MNILRSIPLLALLAFASSAALQAADGTWSSTSAGDWSNTANWSGNTIADGAGFTGTINTNITANTIVTIDTTSRTLGTLNIGDTNNTHSFTLASSGDAFLTLDNNGAGAHINQLSTSKGDTISANISLADNTTLSNASGNNLLVSGIISGDSGVTIDSTGAGAVRFTGVNTYTGGTVIKSGALSVGLTGALGTGDITLGDSANTGAAISLLYAASAGANASFANNIIVTGTGAATLKTTSWGATFSGQVTLNRDLLVGTDTGNNLTLSGKITGTGGLIVENAGSSSIAGNNLVNLSGANDYSGGTIIRRGRLNLGSATAAGTGGITLGDAANTGQTVFLSANITGTIANAINVVGTGDATLGVTSNNPTISGPITLGRNLTLSASNNSGSALTVSGNIGGTGNLTTYANGNGTSASRVILSGSVNHIGDILVTAGTVNASASSRGTTISGVIGSNVRDLVQTSATSWLTLTNANNAFTGKVDIQAGLLRLGSGVTTTTATFLTDTTSLYLYTTDSSGLFLNFANNSVMESIAGLYIDGAAQELGTWGSIGSGAQFESALITGTGLLNVTGAIPEPSACTLLAAASTLGLAVLRRRRS